MDIKKKYIKSIISKTEIYWILILLSLTVLLLSCETEIDSNIYAEDIPVVYCNLNTNDSLHYVKLTKTFIGNQDANKMAKYSDSLYPASPAFFM